MKKLFAAVAAFALLAAPVARAQAIDPALEADVRCAAVGFLVVGNADDNAQVQQAGLMVSIYYLGRIQGRAPNFDLENALVRHFQELTPAQFEQERVRCGGEVQTAGVELQAMGRRIGERARQLEQ